MIELKRSTYQAIRYACLKFHYAKAVPSIKYGYNIYQDKEWCGVILFGLGANRNIASPFGLLQGEVFELVRVALNGKQKTTSECVAAAMRQLHKDAPQIKLLVSYADCDQGHVGTIYQATNWIYLGKCGENKRSAFIINGKKIHPRTIGSSGGKQMIEWVRTHIDDTATEFISNGKEKYIFVFDKKLRKKLLKDAKPYPKNDFSDKKG